MLTVYTSTCCRPDLVQLLADALVVTLQEPYEFVVHVHRGGISRPWRNVARVIRSEASGYNAWLDLRDDAAGRDSVWLHDDLVPVSPWSRAVFPLDHVERPGGHTIQFHAGGWGPPMPIMGATRIECPEQCPDYWEPFRDLAGECRVESLAGGVFLHLDKGTLAHPSSPASARKRELVEAIAAHLGIDAPEPLTADELEAHPGQRDHAAGQGVEQMGLGDLVAAGLSAVGITKKRVEALVGGPCGCAERQEALNALGRSLGIGRVDPPT